MVPAVTAAGNQVRTVTVFLPVADAAGLRTAIAAVARGAESVFAREGRTHVARMIVLDDLVPQGRAQRRPDHLSRPYLLFSAAVDVPPARAGDPLGFWLEGLVVTSGGGAGGEAVGGGLAAVFARCDGCPGIADSAAFTRWMRSHELPAGLEVTADRTATAREIIAALALRAQVKELAVRLRGASAAEIRKACEEAFPALARVREGATR